MKLLLSGLPSDFPVTMEEKRFFLDFLSGPVAVWAVRILAVLIFAGIIAWWIYLEKKNGPED
ncbi:MAG: hypothetical protein K6E98_04680 [Lachnospiraceae bacterium]|nr:hypothetical protein [Lachnospiraceae bacterium]